MPNMDEGDNGVVNNHKMINSPSDSVRAVLILINGHRGGLDGWSSMTIVGRKIWNHNY